MKWADREILLEMLDKSRKFLKEGEITKAKKQLEVMAKGQYVRKKKLRKLVERYESEKPPNEPLQELSDLISELKDISQNEPEWDKWENNP